MSRNVAAFKAHLDARLAREENELALDFLSSAEQPFRHRMFYASWHKLKSQLNGVTVRVSRTTNWSWFRSEGGYLRTPEPGESMMPWVHATIEVSRTRWLLHLKRPGGWRTHAMCDEFCEAVLAGQVADVL